MDETTDTSRSLIAVSGADAVHFLQGLLTQDVTKLASDGIQFAALLSPQGKILHDMFLVDGARIGLAAGTILLDTPALYKDTLLKRLALYKLRAQVASVPLDAVWNVHYTRAGGLIDPRHPDLPRRIYTMADTADDITAREYGQQLLALGIPDSTRDFAPDEVVPLDAGYDLLNAVSFTKGCYVGQEITARMHYKNIARRGFYILELDDKPVQLALLKFEEAEKANHLITRDGITYHARLPGWMAPKLKSLPPSGGG